MGKNPVICEKAVEKKQTRRKQAAGNTYRQNCLITLFSTRLMQTEEYLCYVKTSGGLELVTKGQTLTVIEKALTFQFILKGLKISWQEITSQVQRKINKI